MKLPAARFTILSPVAGFTRYHGFGNQRYFSRLFKQKTSLSSCHIPAGDGRGLPGLYWLEAVL